MRRITPSDGGSASSRLPPLYRPGTLDGTHAGACWGFCRPPLDFKRAGRAFGRYCDIYLLAPPSFGGCIAVCRYERGKDQEYFSDGLSEELIDMLTKVPELRVPARTSSFYFKGKQMTIADIAKALGVAHVLEGSVRKSGNTLRITAQLIRVDNGYHVWSETYDRKLDDIFKIQDEIADAVVTALRVHLLPLQQPSAQERAAYRES